MACLRQARGRMRGVHGGGAGRAPACADMAVGAEQAGRAGPRVVALRPAMPLVPAAPIAGAASTSRGPGRPAGAEGQQREVRAEVAQQPAAAVAAAARRRPARRARIAPSKASTSGVFSGEPCSVAGTDRRPLLTSVRANGEVARQRQHRVAEQPADLALGRDEVGRAGRVAAGSRRRRIRARWRSCRAGASGALAAQHGGELPGQVLGVLHAGVGAARAERARRRAPRRRRTARGRGGSGPCAGRRRCRRWPIRA